jgi:hypothetical protein
MMRLALVAPLAAEAQSKMYRIGNLVGTRQTTPEIHVSEILCGA